MKIKVISTIMLVTLLAAACTSTPSAEATSAPIMEQEPTATEAVVEESMESKQDDTAMATEVSFSADIWPVLEQFAFPAHGIEGEGGVFLESYEDVVKYVVPGNPEASELYKRLTGDGVPVMPPSGKLPDETIQLFYDWIAQGALDN